MSFFRRTYAVLWKDLLIEARSKQALSSMIVYSGITLLILGIALGPDTAEIRRAAPALLWIAVIFTSVLGLSRSFDSERENRGIEGLLLYPDDRSAVFVGKFGALVVLLVFVEAVLILLASLLYDLQLWAILPKLAGVALLGIVGLAGVGTLYGALTLNVRAREVLLPVLVFPLVVPAVLASVAATRLLLEGDPMDQFLPWIKLLVAFDIVFTVTPLLLFERVLTD